MDIWVFWVLLGGVFMFVDDVGLGVLVVVRDFVVILLFVGVVVVGVWGMLEIIEEVLGIFMGVIGLGFVIVGVFGFVVVLLVGGVGVGIGIVWVWGRSDEDCWVIGVSIGLVELLFIGFIGDFLLVVVLVDGFCVLVVVDLVIIIVFIVCGVVVVGLVMFGSFWDWILVVLVLFWVDVVCWDWDDVVLGCVERVGGRVVEGEVVLVIDFWVICFLLFVGGLVGFEFDDELGLVVLCCGGKR